ncbi:hypothetical protein D3C72_2532440 [compost metagenome]
MGASSGKRNSTRKIASRCNATEVGVPHLIFSHHFSENNCIAYEIMDHMGGT